MSCDEDPTRESAILSFETAGNKKVQENMRRLLEQGVIKVARPSKVEVKMSAQPEVVAAKRRQSLRSSAREVGVTVDDKDTIIATKLNASPDNKSTSQQWSWEDGDTSNDSLGSFSGGPSSFLNTSDNLSKNRSTRGDSPAGPAFVKILLQSHVTGEFRLPAPCGLCDFLPVTTRSLTLRCDGESWKCSWSVGTSCDDASLAGNWRGFVEDQQLKVGDAVTLKKEQGANLKVAIHRAVGVEDETGHKSVGGSIPKNIPKENWQSAFTEARILTDALFVNHGSKPGLAVVEMPDVALKYSNEGGGTDPATHVHSRRTMRDGRRKLERKETTPQKPVDTTFFAESRTEPPASAPFASPKPAEKHVKVTLYTFLSPDATPAPPSEKTRAFFLEKSQHDAGHRAPLRVGETRRRGELRNPLETPVTPTSVKGIDSVADRGNGRVDAPVPSTSRPNTHTVHSTGTDTKRPVRRQTPRFVSSTTGAAPLEGWTTPSVSAAANLTAHKKSKSSPKLQLQMNDYHCTPDGTPLSQVFKSTKRSAGRDRVNSVSKMHVQAFVTPVSKQSGAEVAALAAKRRRRG